MNHDHDIYIACNSSKSRAFEYTLQAQCESCGWTGPKRSGSFHIAKQDASTDGYAHRGQVSA